MVVTVTQEHINKARRLITSSMASHECACPIALALWGLGCTSVSVGSQKAIVGKDYSSCIKYDLPQAARDFIKAFDSCVAEPLEPFTFSLSEGDRR